MRFKLLKKVLAISLAVLAVLTSIPLTASAANVETAEVGATTKKATFRDTGIEAVETSHVAEAGETHTHLSVDGKNAYCIMPGYDLWGSTVLTPYDSDTWDNLSKTQDGLNIQEAVTTVLAYGAEGNLTKLQSLVSKLTYDEAYVATQVLVWEFVDGQRNATYPYELKKGKSGYISTFCKGGKNPRVKAAYNSIIDEMGDFQTIPSFTHIVKSKAPIQKVTTSKVGGNWQKLSIPVTDENKVLSYFDFTGTYDVGNGKVKVTQSGNELTVAITEVRETGTPKSVSVGKQKDKSKLPLEGKGEIIAYGAVDGDNGDPNQQVVTLDTTKSSIDPPTAYMNLAINLAEADCDARIQKTIVVDGTKDKVTESSSLEGWYFRIYLPDNAVSDKYFDSNINEKPKNIYIVGPTDTTGLTVNSFSEVIANKNGTLEYGMPEGTYKIEELGKKKSGTSGSYLDHYYMPDGYEPSGDKTVTLTEEKGTTVVFEYKNTFKIPLKIKKICEDGVKPTDFYFRAQFSNYVYLLKADGNGYMHLVDMSTGTADASTTLYLPQGTYTITELGKLKSGKSATSVTASNYEIPAKYGTPMDIEVTVSAKAYERAIAAGDDAIYAEFHNTVSYPIGIVKTDANTKEALAGAVFGIYADEHCTNLLDTVTTGSDGMGISSKQFRYGTYFVREITPPPYYELSDKVYEVVVHHQSTWVTVDTIRAIRCDTSNTLLPTFVKIYKVDEETKTPLKGAVFGLYSNKACTSSYLLEKITTGSDGYGKSAKAYPPGTYYLKELTAPIPYIKSNDILTVTITKTTTTGAEKLITRTNPIYKTSIGVVKKEDGKDVYLAGAVYGLYSDKACTKLLETLPATDSSGNAVTKNKYRPGTYYLREITPPTYYELSSEVLTVTITNANATAGTVVKKTATDTPIPIYVRVYKTDEETDKPLSGAVFGLYSNKACTDGYLLEEITTDSTGYGKSAKAYPPGTYYLKERKAPSGFKLDSTIITVTLSKQTSAGKVVTVNRTNPPLEVYLSLYKKDKNTQEALAGAVYGLYSDKACKNLLEPVTIKDNGVGTTKYTYRIGTYYWKEITPPENYELSDEVIPVTVALTDVIKGSTVRSTAYDEPIEVSLIIVKYDSDISANGKRLSGAVIGVYEDKECKKLIEEIGPTVAENNGQAISSKKYKLGDTVYLKEHKAPYGYELRDYIAQVDITTDLIELSMKVTNTTDMIIPDDVDLFVTHRFWNKAIKSKIAVQKKDSKTGQLLAGASFWVCDVPGCYYPRWASGVTDENGYLLFSYEFNPGQTVWVKEASPPDGYLNNNTIYEVTIPYTDKEDNIILLEYENPPKDTPITIRKTCSTTKLPVAGATYRAYSSNAKDSNGMLLDKNVICDEFVTGSDGMAKIPVMFAVGEVFYIQEYKAPDTHSLSKTITKVTVVEDMGVIEVTDPPIVGGAVIIKTDADGNPMQGVKFEVYRKSDNKKIQLYTVSLSANIYAFAEYGTSSSMTYTPATGANGKIELVSFPIGEYYLLEVGGADEYMPYGTKIPFIVEVNPDKPTTGTKVEIKVANHLPIIWNTGGMGITTFYTTSIIALALSLIALSLFTVRTAKKLKKSN